MEGYVLAEFFQDDFVNSAKSDYVPRFEIDYMILLYALIDCLE